METRIGKWGNSLALRIPQSIAARVGITLNAAVELTPRGEQLVVSVLERPGTELDDLLARVTDDNVHGEVETGPLRGRRSVVTPPGRVPERGDAVWIDFDPQSGREQAGRRPAVVLSPAAYNGKVGLALLCPITGRIKGYPFEVGCGSSSSAAESVSTAARQEAIGSVTAW